MARKWYAVYVGHVPGVYENGQSVRPKSLASPAEARKGFIAERKPKLVT